MSCSTTKWEPSSKWSPPCGDVYKPALSAWKRYTYMYVQKKYQANRMGFLQTKGRFMKQFSAPTIKMIVWNNNKVCCPSLSQPDGFGGRKGRINGSSLWQKKHLLLKKSPYFFKGGCERTDAHIVDTTAGNQAWITPTSECCSQWWSLWKCMWRY